MKNLTTFLLLFALSIPCFSQYVLSDEFIQFKPNKNMEQKFTYKNLRLYPLFAGEKYRKEHQHIGEYSNLSEAIENKKIVIVEGGSVSEDSTEIDTSRNEIRINTERNINPVNQSVETNLQDYDVQVQQNVLVNIGHGGGDQVNKLFIKNTSNDTIYIMAGEVVKGGKQDRVLAQDMILPPNNKFVDISVFCVEKNRWHYSSGAASAFTQSMNVSANSIRSIATKAKSQSMVWEKVDEITSKNKAGSSTGTYNALQNSEEFKEKYKAYENFFTKAFGRLNYCIGFIGVSGDSIIGCDIFATPQLFQKQSKSLFSAYITEAISTGKSVTMKSQKVEKYLQTFLDEKINQDAAIDRMGVQFEHKARKLHITTY